MSSASPESVDDPGLSCSSVKEVEKEETEFSLKCKPQQRIFCLGDPRKTYQGRIFEYQRTTSMLDKVNKHLGIFSPKESVVCPHPICQMISVSLPGIMDFKNHVANVHKIALRSWLSE